MMFAPHTAYRLRYAYAQVSKETYYMAKET